MDDELDRTDLKILRLLQSDGRLGNAEIAKRVNTSPATCHRRIQRLFAEGYVTSVRAQIAPQKVEMGTLAFVGVVLDRSTPESFGAFEEAIREMKLVLDCHIVAGDFDYILKIRVRDMADFNKLHADRLIALPGVRQTRTFFVMKEVVDNAIDEFIMGNGKEVQISLEGNKVSVRDFGRGIPLGKVVDCVSKINTGAKYNDDVFQFSVGLNGVGTKAVNALSKNFYVRSHRDGEFAEASFKVGKLKKEDTGKTKEPNGTLIEFEPDEAIFKDSEFRMEHVERRRERDVVDHLAVAQHRHLDGYDVGLLRSAEEQVGILRLPGGEDLLDDGAVVAQRQARGSDRIAGEAFNVSPVIRGSDVLANSAASATPYRSRP